MLINRTEIALALPGYEIGGQIGRGGFGLVFTAKHRRLGAVRAVKVIAAVEADGPEPSRRFLAEAQLMTELDHPHLVRVFEYAEHGTVRLLVMEYLPGGTLTERLNKPVTPQRACAWALSIAEGLHAAHSLGVAHRDIKPDNLLFTADGLLKVSDFGIAKLFDGTAVSASGLIGTPLYMAPEQFLGAPVGPAADLYSLGTTIYRTLANRTPFTADLSLAAVMRQHLEEPPAPLDDVPPHIAAVVLRTLAKRPADRPASAREFALDLARAARTDFGAGWISSSGVPLRVDPAVLLDATPAAAVTRARQRAVPTEPRQAARQSTEVVDAPAPIAPVAPRVTTRRRWLVAAGCVAAPAVLLGTGYLGTVLVGRDDDTEAGAAPSSTAPYVATTARLDHVLKGHTGDVYVAEFDPHRPRLASGGKDNSLRLWDSLTGAQIGPTRPSQHNAVYGLAYSPSGSTLATGYSDGTIGLRDPLTGTPRGAVLTGHSSGVNAVAFNHDGTELASASTDKTIRLWDVATGNQIGPALTGHTNTVTWVAFSPDGARVASASSDKTVRLWDVATRTRIGGPMSGHTDKVWSVAFSPDGNRLATASDDSTVRLWDVVTRRQLGPALTGHTGEVNTVAFSPDGALLASAGGDGSIGLWNPDTGKLINFVATDHERYIWSVAFSPDSKRLATASADRTVRLWTLS
jgi:WD40 repeat protein